jgi:hypothetical protein
MMASERVGYARLYVADAMAGTVAGLLFIVVVCVLPPVLVGIIPQPKRESKR